MDFLNKILKSLSGLPIIGKLIIWLFSKLFTKSQRYHDKRKSQTLVVIGSHNYIDGQSIDTETEVALSQNSKYISGVKGAHITAKISSSKNRLTQDCFRLDCFGENFLLSMKNLKEIYTKNYKKSKLKNDIVIAILKNFYSYSPNDISISRNRNFYSVLIEELKHKNIILEIDTIEESILKIPFHSLTESDFNGIHNFLSVNLNKKI